jgi:Ca-activated chloride channel family protein
VKPRPVTISPAATAGAALRPLPALALLALAAMALGVCRAAAASATPPRATAAQARATLAKAWSNLWWTRDQQGQRLLQADEPAQAAQRFSDPRRRAFAQLTAGEYAQAAQGLAAFHDAQSEYNRGNALARAGRLKEALDAYDAALAQAPNDRDARHNRDLVARALRQSGQRQGQQQGQHGQQGQGQQQQQGQGQAGGAHPHNSDGREANGGKPGDRGQNGQGGQSGQSGTGQQQQQQQQNATTGERPDALPRAAGSQPAAHGNDRNGAAGRDGAAGADGELAGNASKTPPTLAIPPPGGASQAAKPPSEQALSLQQWLRRIPDDPGGLLRRKFLIEHLMRQRGSDP